jgi:hypothetical protein
LAFTPMPAISFKHVGQENSLNDTYDPEEIKALFDAPPEEVRVALNTLIAILNSTTSGSSGSENIGSATIAGLSGNTVHAQLTDMLAVAQAAQAGAILPGTVTDAMLSNTAGQIKDTIMFQTAEGTATAITLTLATLTDGYNKTFIASANNNGAATTINTKPLYKPNTTTAPTLIAGKAYTVWYDTTNTCFFLKASAEGDAVVANVLAGKTFSNDSDTGLTGTMTDRAGDTAALSSSVSGTTLKLLASDGYRDGVDDNVTITDADFAAANILSGKTIFGVAGTAVNGAGMKGYAYGSATIDASGNITVTGLSFRPSVIVGTWNSVKTAYLTAASYDLVTNTSGSHTVIAISCTPNASGFTMRVASSGHAGSTAAWYAYE